MRVARLRLERNVARLGRYEAHMRGLCATATLYLFEKLRAEGMDAVMVAGVDHWFVVCDGWLVDITATQFGQRPIVIRRYRDVVRDIHRGTIIAPWWHERARFEAVPRAGLEFLRQEMEAYFSEDPTVMPPSFEGDD